MSKCPTREGQPYRIKDYGGLRMRSIEISIHSSLNRHRDHHRHRPEMRQPREPRGAGVKILWIWTLGTAAIMVTNVIRTRVQDLDQQMNTQQQQIGVNGDDAISVDPSFPTDEGVIREVK
ncbi:hypothetical protein ACFE04_013091 [Oxalis oulophora]